MADLKLENVTKIFDKHAIGLKDFSIEVKNGEFFTVLGPSGSGKSTVLRIIAGLEKQNGGNILIDGINVNESPPQQRNVSFVFQNYALYPHMNVYENIAVGLRIKHYSTEEIHSRIKDVAKLLEISELLKRKPKALSGGQRQRVALARAIAKRPNIFLLDEPLSNLDALLRERMRTELKLLFKQLKTTVIYVTHDQQEAISLSDRIALIDKGTIKQIGSYEKLYYEPNSLFVASFLGSPHINTFEVAIEERAFVFGASKWEISSDYLPRIKGRKKVMIGIRPEDVRVYLEPDTNRFPVEFLEVEKMGKYVVLNLKWRNEILKAVVEKKLLEGIRKEDSLWINFDEKTLQLFDTHNYLSL